MDVDGFLKDIYKNNEKITPKVYSKKVLTNHIKNKLFSYQENHVVKLINILLQFFIAIDSGDTGTGKTYSAGATCYELKRRPIVVCPKTLIYNWIAVLEFFGVKAYDVVNYETIRNGKTYQNNKYKTRKASPFIKRIDPDPEDPLKSIFEWDLPSDAIIIFDECHRCKDPATDNGKLLASTRQAILKKIPVLLLSATICEKFTDMKIPFYLLGFIPNTRNFKHYIKSLRQKYPQYRVKRANYTKKQDYLDAIDNSKAMIIHDEIHDYCSRIRVRDLGNLFPQNQVCCQQFVAEETEKITEAYAEIAELMQQLKNNPGPNHLSRIQKLKQEIEFRKVPIFVEQAQLFLDDGKSVIIFVNYLDTLHVISQQLDIKCKIYGDQTLEQRQEAINLFQSNQERIIILQMRAGGVGISLHDLYGGHMRATLLNFPDTGSDLIQALGRAYRAGAKTPVLQRIVFVANVDYEKTIMRNINKKLTNIGTINDKDVSVYKYGVKKITRRVIKNNKNPDIDLADQAVLKNI